MPSEVLSSPRFVDTERLLIRHLSEQADHKASIKRRVVKQYMAKRLFIGGIPYRMTDEELQQLLSQAGAVESVTIVTDRMTGRSKGFAFADMANDEDAKKAIELLNGKDVDGRKIVVNEARPREERPSFDRGGAGGGGSRFGGGDRRRGGPRHS